MNEIEVFRFDETNQTLPTLSKIVGSLDHEILHKPLLPGYLLFLPPTPSLPPRLTFTPNTTPFHSRHSLLPSLFTPTPPTPCKNNKHQPTPSYKHKRSDPAHFSPTHAILITLITLIPYTLHTGHTINQRTDRTASLVRFIHKHPNLNTVG